MLQRAYRLPRTIRFSHPTIISSPYFTIKIVKNDCSYNRYGFIVSKGVDKRATRRNRIKRRIRAGIEHLRNQITSGHDMLFIIKKTAVERTTAELWNEIKKCLESKKLIL